MVVLTLVYLEGSAARVGLTGCLHCRAGLALQTRPNVPTQTTVPVTTRKSRDLRTLR